MKQLQMQGEGAKRENAYDGSQQERAIGLKRNKIGEEGRHRLGESSVSRKRVRTGKTERRLGRSVVKEGEPIGHLSE